jgi:glycosyltransferase involved in cell wall biosynthesis
MRITVVSPVLSIAGVPLAQIRFARALARRGHDVTLLVGWIDSTFTLPDLEGAEVEELGRRQVRRMFVPLCAHLRRSRPDVVFSAEDHLNCVVLLAAMVTGSRAKISGSSRVTPYDTYASNPLDKRWVLKQLMRLAMRRADALTCVSQDMVAQYRTLFPSSKHVCVYNIVDDVHSRRLMREAVDDEWFHDADRPLLVAAGRLAPWKGFADLIEAMALGPADRGARLLILGDGPLRTELAAQVERLGLRQSVRLMGYVDNPLKYFARAQVFVLSSLVEGMPNVLVEAMMCGCTPVATDCPTGPRELLDGGRIGQLVAPRNPPALARGILAALETPVATEALMRAVMPFAEGAVIDRHFELLGLAPQDAVAGDAR